MNNLTCHIVKLTEAQTNPPARLQNKIVENAIIICIHPNHINKSLLHFMTQGSYDNHVQWNSSVMAKKKPGKKCTMLLYNGNHHCHYLHQHCTSSMEYYFWLQDAKVQRNSSMSSTSQSEKKTHQEGSWLAAFYDTISESKRTSSSQTLTSHYI